METTLRVFYARAVPLLAALAAGLFLLMIMAGAALAQDAAAVKPPGILDMAATTLSAALAGTLTILAATVVKQLPSWAKPWVEHKLSAEAKDWTLYTDVAVNRAKAYAEKKLKGAKDGNKYVNLVLEYLSRYEPEIVRWADKDGDGVLDFLEPFLPEFANPPKPPVADVATIPRKVTRASAEKAH